MSEPPASQQVGPPEHHLDGLNTARHLAVAAPPTFRPRQPPGMSNSALWIVSVPQDSSPEEQLDELEPVLTKGKLGEAAVLHFPDFKVRSPTLGWLDWAGTRGASWR